MRSNFDEIFEAADVSALTDIGYDGYTCIEVEDKAFEKSQDDAKKAVVLSANYLRPLINIF